MPKSINRNRIAFRKTGLDNRNAPLSDRNFSIARTDQRAGVEVSYLNASASIGEEDLYETLCCLKWGAHYGLITVAAYESGKADLLARM
jgi:hypothetical protein